MKITHVEDEAEPPLKRRVKIRNNLIVLFWILAIVAALSLFILFILPEKAHATEASRDAVKNLTPLLVKEKPKEKKMPVGEFPKPEKVELDLPDTSYKQPLVTTPVYSGDVWALGKQMCIVRFGIENWESMNALVDAESGWNPQACNPNSGAFGLGQALPASKMSPYGDINDPAVQLMWMCDYIQNRYGTPNNAWAFWQQKHWY